MTDIREETAALIARIVDGEGEAPRAHRAAAFHNTDLPQPLSTLVTKVALPADRVTDDDIAAARSSGHTEDELFEIIVCAAAGQARRQHDVALTALHTANGRT